MNSNEELRVESKKERPVDGEKESSKPIKFIDDDLYRRSYDASIVVLKNVIPFLKDDDMMRYKLANSVQVISSLVAADVADRPAKCSRVFALAEASRKCREVVVMLSYCKDLHGQFINGNLCEGIINTYRNIDDRIKALSEISIPKMKMIGC